MTYNVVATMNNSPHWFFLILSGILLIVELLGTSGYSLWSGVSAFFVAIIAWIIPFSWTSLWIIFAILTMVTAYVWFLWLKHKNMNQLKKRALNQPKSDLIGIKTVVVEAITNGNGRVKINDGTWMATSDQNLAVGERVKVVDVDGLILKVNKTQ